MKINRRKFMMSLGAMLIGSFLPYKLFSSDTKPVKYITPNKNVGWILSKPTEQCQDSEAFQWKIYNDDCLNAYVIDESFITKDAFLQTYKRLIEARIEAKRTNQAQIILQQNINEICGKMS